MSNTTAYDALQHMYEQPGGTLNHDIAVQHSIDFLEAIVAVQRNPNITAIYHMGHGIDRTSMRFHLERHQSHQAALSIDEELGIPEHCYCTWPAAYPHPVTDTECHIPDSPDVVTENAAFSEYRRRTKHEAHCGADVYDACSCRIRNAAAGNAAYTVAHFNHENDPDSPINDQFAC